MKAALLYNYKKELPYNLKIEDVQIDKPKAGEALIRVVAAGTAIPACMQFRYITISFFTL